MALAKLPNTCPNRCGRGFGYTSYSALHHHPQPTLIGHGIIMQEIPVTLIRKERHWARSRLQHLLFSPDVLPEHVLNG